MRVIREETFGPILTVERFTTEDEAIALGNDTEYGLAGAVWTADIGPRAARGRRAAARHGVDQRLPPVRPRGGVGRDEARPATVASSARRVWPSTRSTSTSGTTPRRSRCGGSRADRSIHRRRPHDSRSEPGQRRRIAEFGYSQTLDRSIGKFASFAAGVSYISILTGTFQLFYFGFGTGGAGVLVVVAAGLRRPVHGGALVRRAGRALPGGRFGLQLVEAARPAPPRRGWRAG